MIGSLGIAPFSPSTAASASTAVLEAQLARSQVALADWQGCPSCKTPEGKAMIAAISTRIDQIQQRINAAQSTNQRNGITRAADAQTIFSISGTAASPGLAKEGPLGQHLDVFA